MKIHATILAICIIALSLFLAACATSHEPGDHICPQCGTYNPHRLFGIATLEQFRGVDISYVSRIVEEDFRNRVPCCEQIIDWGLMDDMCTNILRDLFPMDISQWIVFEEPFLENPPPQGFVLHVDHEPERLTYSFTTGEGYEGFRELYEVVSGTEFRLLFQYNGQWKHVPLEPQVFYAIAIIFPLDGEASGQVRREQVFYRHLPPGVYRLIKPGVIRYQYERSYKLAIVPNEEMA